MDPNVTLQEINTLVTDVLDRRVPFDSDTFHQIEERVDALLDWILHGGFGPDWSKYPVGEAYYISAMNYRH